MRNEETAPPEVPTQKASSPATDTGTLAAPFISLSVPDTCARSSPTSRFMIATLPVATTLRSESLVADSRAYSSRILLFCTSQLHYSRVYSLVGKE